MTYYHHEIYTQHADPASIDNKTGGYCYRTAIECQAYGTIHRVVHECIPIHPGKYDHTLEGEKKF